VSYLAAPPEMDGPAEVLWDEDLARQSRANYRRARRIRLGRPEKQAKLRALLVERQNGLCHYCSRQMTDEPIVAGQKVSDERATLEHLTPHAEGGETSEENCRAACHLCNGLKGKLDWAIRSLERAMREGFTHEIHYYAERLKVALEQWEARLAHTQAMQSEVRL
jgi:hypothetical protein